MEAALRLGSAFARVLARDPHFSIIKRDGHILVMEQGRIVEEGSHESLMGRGGIYPPPAGSAAQRPRGERGGEWFSVRGETRGWLS
ncbi:MAG: hypothetical protein HY789_04905 [Deltaproteobacteria bacterium]|nr:hypothetical protein [Deltaproteobacteria bacterium]